MHRKRLLIASITAFLLAFGCLFFLVSANAADSVDVNISRKHDPLMKVRIRWVADGSGNVEDAATGNPITLPFGYLVAAYFVADTGGTQPSDEYNVYLRSTTWGTDFDWLTGVGVGLEQTLSDSSNLRTPLTNDGGFPLMFLIDDYYVNVDSAGADNAGYIFLIIQEVK